MSYFFRKKCFGLCNVLLLVTWGYAITVPSKISLILFSTNHERKITMLKSSINSKHQKLIATDGILQSHYRKGMYISELGRYDLKLKKE